MAQLTEQIRDSANQYISLSRHKEVAEILESLEKKSVYIEQGSDDLRVKFKTLQGAIEQVLATAKEEGLIRKVVGVIHTPTPTTPLCTPLEEVDDTLTSPSIRGNKEKLSTIQTRAQALRDYLGKGGILYVAYPKAGLLKRTDLQRELYLEQVRKYPEKLFDSPMPIKEMDPELIGAFYLFEDQEGVLYAFSIKAKQSFDPSEYSEWGIWLGELSTPVVQERIRKVHHYLHSIGGPNLNREFSLCSPM